MKNETLNPTARVWVVCDYEALPCQITNNLNTSTND